MCLSCMVDELFVKVHPPDRQVALGIFTEPIRVYFSAELNESSQLLCSITCWTRAGMM